MANKFSESFGTHRNCNFLFENVPCHVARVGVWLGAFIQGCCSPLCGRAGCTPFFFSTAGKEIMSENFVKCPCQNCNKNIEFDSSMLNGEQVAVANCPHCGLETQIFIQGKPKQEPEKQSILDAIRSQKNIIIVAVVGVLIATAWAFMDSDSRSQVGKAVLGICVFIIGGVIMWNLSKNGTWLHFLSILLFAFGSIAFAAGGVYGFQIETNHDSTVFQEYEALFLIFGGVLVIALSLILAAILSLKKK